ncbi:MAG TPA: NADPH:quinone reductase, partial [Streptosporangiaceae bacterium]|nr:NADPH:quinone reductase [Streptosporangiaceae bacterium]
MRAASYDRTGPAAEVLRVAEVERPEPGPGEVRVRVHASGINPTDVKTRAGVTPRPIDGFQVPHHDGAGVIDAVGPGGPARRIGERVWVWFAANGRRWGTAAEWTVVPERQAVPLPDGVSFELGASLGVPAMTGHYCVLADGPVRGSTVLVAGGAGAVGHFAIQFAVWGGAETVVATASGPAKAQLAQEAGAAHVVSYREPDAAGQIRAAAGGPVDRIIEVALGANLPLDLAVSRVGTTAVCYAAEPADPVLPVRACMTANVVLRFVLLYGIAAAALDEAVVDISAALRAGALSGLPAHR